MPMTDARFVGRRSSSKRIAVGIHTFFYENELRRLIYLLGNLDPGLMNLLCAYFPREVRAKQKENERQLAIDQFGKDSSIKCQVM